MYEHSVLLTEDQIQSRVAELAKTLNRDYRGKTLNAVCVLKGAILFTADLVRHLDIPVRLHFVQTASYQDSTVSSGTIQLVYSSVQDVRDLDLLVIEDVIDTGLTLDRLVRWFLVKGASAVRSCVLLDKQERRKVQIRPDYTGFLIPNQFVIGYGLDYREFGRNLRYVGVLAADEYEK